MKHTLLGEPVPDQREAKPYQPLNPADPFLLPDGKVQIAFSGGRTSAMMLHHIAERNGGVPEDRCAIIFTNTGREMPATLDFVAECGRRWGLPIIWLEYCLTEDAKPSWRETGSQGASRNGEPFEAVITHRGYPPNIAARFCTTELKIRTAERFIRNKAGLGWAHWTCALGMRADEQRRLKAGRDVWANWYPMAEAGLGRHDVTAFWQAQPFDLQLFARNGKAPLGNCDGCFLKSEATKAMLIRSHPDRAGWWEQMEQRLGKTFRKDWGWAAMRDFLERQGDLADLDDEALFCQADEGECFE